MATNTSLIVLDRSFGPVWPNGRERSERGLSKAQRERRRRRERKLRQSSMEGAGVNPIPIGVPIDHAA